MLYLLSPAKTLDYDTPTPASLLAKAPLPGFLPRSAALIRVLKKKSPQDIAQLMSLSPSLAELNAGRYKAWRLSFTPDNSKPAVLAFDGDVYGGLDATTLKAADLEWAQQHLCILSGLYGVLRPLDLMQPYRLEMGTRLATPKAHDLYGYWGTTLARHLNGRLAGEADPVVVNLASQEYARAVPRKALKARVVDCVFEDWKDGRYRVIGFHAKRARGLMARHAIQRRIATPGKLAGFSAEGYAHAAEASAPERMVFRRRVG
jgi:cytoplasmic iron level regulating protein YaaA (DUF328/UPF0246 family)